MLAAQSRSRAAVSRLILIDATIVRAILLPASMKLLGDWNWYLPKWLEWLPHLEHCEQLEPAKARAVPVGGGR